MDRMPPPSDSATFCTGLRICLVYMGVVRAIFFWWGRRGRGGSGILPLPLERSKIGKCDAGIEKLCFVYPQEVRRIIRFSAARRNTEEAAPWVRLLRWITNIWGTTLVRREQKQSFYSIKAHAKWLFVQLSEAIRLGRAVLSPIILSS